MGPSEPDALVDQLAPLLESYDIALRAGRPADQATAPEMLRAELEGLQACLRRLEKMRPPREGGRRKGDAALFGH